MTEPAWQYYALNSDVVIRHWDNNVVESCYINTPEVQAWLAAGNTILPA